MKQGYVTIVFVNGREKCMNGNIWIMCPICKSKTRTQVRYDTVLEKFPLFCPKCKRESIVTVHGGKITDIESSDADRQSR